jgi:N-acetylneuraminate synthase
MNRDIFEDLFVLELANNHWGSVDRGKRIIDEFGTVVRFNGVHAAIKLQFRDVRSFIHKAYRDRQDIRYIKKTVDTELSEEEMGDLVEQVRLNNCVRMATPFDEHSVDLCVEYGVQIIKVASSDVTDWVLLEKIAKTRKPVIVSTGGTTVKAIDDMVTFFDNRHIPLAINHAVSLYPTEDRDMQLNQIDFLKNRYVDHTIGFSSHEYHDWVSSIMIAYGKGARTFERHIDIKTDDKPFSPYCSTAEQIDTWFKAYAKAREMCGISGIEKAPPTEKEIQYLDALVRGVYAIKDLPPGHQLGDGDYYLAIPLLKGQLSCRELIGGAVLTKACPKDSAITIDMMDNPYSRNENLRNLIMNRGL